MKSLNQRGNVTYTRWNSMLCIWDHVKSLLNLMETCVSVTAWCHSNEHNSADKQRSWLSPGLSAELATVSTPTLSGLPYGWYMVWNKDTAIFTSLFNSCRFTMTSWYLWSYIFTGVTSSSLSLNSCFIAVKWDGVERKFWFGAGTFWDLSCCIRKVTKYRPFFCHVSEEN